jgi:ABC-type branched-subunit amino acid transport system ATPase component
MANGQTVNPASYSFKKTVAYVMQEDAVWSTLTCREALLFAANLRIPSNVSSKQKEDLVDLMIAELGLEKCKNVVCGGELIKGISGGEKKRTCIGLELISNPSLIFLVKHTPTTTLVHTIRRQKSCNLDYFNSGRANEWPGRLFCVPKHQVAEEGFKGWFWCFVHHPPAFI